MGWTYTSKPESTEQFLKDKLAPFQVVAFSRVGNTIYAATTHPETGEEIAAWVIRTASCKKDYPFEFGYKVMHESVGPYYHDCPKKILDMLTPTTEKWALEWRQRCIENQKPKPKFKLKDVLTFAEPISFASLGKHTVFQVCQVKPLRFWCPTMGLVCRLRKATFQKEYTING